VEQDPVELKTLLETGQPLKIEYPATPGVRG
jgi:hypothetical protein